MEMKTVTAISVFFWLSNFSIKEIVLLEERLARLIVSLQRKWKAK
jgi:hypothetical protein